MQMVGTVCSKVFSLGEDEYTAQEAPLWDRAHPAEPAAITAACC